METEKIKVGITQGDVNGIGYEVILKTLLEPRVTESCTPIIYGSAKIAAYHKKALNIENLNLYSIKKAEEATPKKASVINCIDDNTRVELGKNSPGAGKASYDSLERATADLKENKIDVIVTAPINKENIQSDSFKFAGHTEYLASQFEAEDTLMLMVSNELKIGVVTGHIPLSKVSESLSVEKILSKLRILNRSLIYDFNIRKPRIALLALNPHAGDNGLLGSEENEILIPAIEQAKKEDILVLGPYPADGFFGTASFLKFDAVLAMYHDQGLIPFKAMFAESGVNYTAGLPVVRTSPAHGTAYEIAGKNQADESSFRAALFLALDIYMNRKEYDELVSRPLPHYEV